MRTENSPSGYPLSDADLELAKQMGIDTIWVPRVNPKYQPKDNTQAARFERALILRNLLTSSSKYAQLYYQSRQDRQNVSAKARLAQFNRFAAIRVPNQWLQERMKQAQREALLQQAAKNREDNPRAFQQALDRLIIAAQNDPKQRQQSPFALQAHTRGIPFFRGTIVCEGSTIKTSNALSIGTDGQMERACKMLAMAKMRGWKSINIDNPARNKAFTAAMVHAAKQEGITIKNLDAVKEALKGTSYELDKEGAFINTQQRLEEAYENNKISVDDSQPQREGTHYQPIAAARNAIDLAISAVPEGTTHEYTVAPPLFSSGDTG